MSSMGQGESPPAVEGVPLPFLPPSKNAAKFISRADKIDPRYVDLELVGSRSSSRQKRMQGLLYSSSLILSLASLVGTVWLAAGLQKNFPDGRDLKGVQQQEIARQDGAAAIGELTPSKVQQGTTSSSKMGAVVVKRVPIRESWVELRNSASGDNVLETAGDGPVLKEADPRISVHLAETSENSESVVGVLVDPVLVEPDFKKPIRAIEDYGLKELLDEGQRFLKYGDVRAARLFFRRAAEQGLASGALAMGSSYDSKALIASGLAEVSPDESKALKWYRRAHLLADSKKKNDR